MRQTSLMAYEELKVNLARRQAEVLKAIRALKQATDKDLVAYLQWPINCVTPRRLELVRMGKVMERGEIVQDGRRATTWAAC